MCTKYPAACSLFRTALSLELLAFSSLAFSAEVIVDPTAEHRPISEFIYGKNNNLSSNPNDPLSETNWQRLRDSGITFVRETGGNNSSKYNWVKKITSHPDWYNTVNPSDWDYAAMSLAENLPDVYGMWAVPALGWAAKTDEYNFDCWAYDQCIGGDSHANWTGDGDPFLYLEEWPPEKATGILPHWFEKEGLGLPFEKFKYWNIDNEPDIWASTHDDIITDPITFEDFFKKYTDTAKLMRTLYPDIRIVGPVFTNEWQWYSWNNDAITAPNGDKYNTTEYFLKRLGEEEAASGMILLDVFDIHWYPGENNAYDVGQLHRVLFDTTYDYPGANGLRRLNGGWDASLKKEYILKRIRDWSTDYLGREIALAMSEFGLGGVDENLAATNYASMLGTMADEGVEIFCPWSWKPSYMEVLHLFSVYTGTTSVSARSDDEEFIGSYASLSPDGGSLSVVLVNRKESATEDITISIQNSNLSGDPITVRQLSDFGSEDTFISASENAQQVSQINAEQNTISLSIPSLSITALEIPLSAPVAIDYGALELVSSERQSDGTFNISFQGQQNVIYELVASDNLKDWQVVETFIEATNLNFSPAEQGYDKRFFCRARIAKQ